MNQQALNFDSPPPPVGPVHRAIATIQLAPLGFKSVTESWLLNNKQVWIEFYKATEWLRMNGERRGAKCVWEHLRYKTPANDSDPTFRLNNTSVSGLARLYNEVTGTDYFEVRT